ncbi:hypothetical protein [Embleya scabrispora]|uniref:hypothetical protein n=1 Tax=Embleya scabrispora TaxID=159449 RepID=UPI0003784568|nr:hypothetical protein [Embleya scabrispora]
MTTTRGYAATRCVSPAAVRAVAALALLEQEHAPYPADLVAVLADAGGDGELAVTRLEFFPGIGNTDSRMAAVLAHDPDATAAVARAWIAQGDIDEFTETTSAAIVEVGGARRGKAIIVLNPAEPPLIMRDTVLALVRAPGPDTVDEIRGAVAAMVASVAGYVPGYRLKQEVQVTPVPADQPLETLPAPGADRPTHQVSVFLEVEGAAHYLPAYAGNLDIMTSAALRVGDRMAARGPGADSTRGTAPQHVEAAP